jgi:adenosine/AMP kinase
MSASFSVTSEVRHKLVIVLVQAWPMGMLITLKDIDTCHFTFIPGPDVVRFEFHYNLSMNTNTDTDTSQQRQILKKLRYIQHE